VIRLLVVDDEPHLLRALVLNLTNRGYDVATASTAALALAQVRRLPPDVLVLDLGLPDRDGSEVIREIHADQPALPIIVLSARNGSHDKIHALDLGAVDYVTKPFDMTELVARLGAVIRRAGIEASAQQVTVGAIDIDLAKRIARHHDGTTVRITPIEWRILDVLLRRPGRLIRPQELLAIALGDAVHTERGDLRICLAKLRQVLEPEPSRPRYLLTEPGVGYRFQP
jgi:two-component system, OmpR family, KDP operon response regulator KdpE